MKKLIVFILSLVMVLGVGVTSAFATFQFPQVTICHTPPPIDITLQVNLNALGGHLGHGDYLGECEEEEPEPTPLPSPVPCEQTEQGCEVSCEQTEEGCPEEEATPSSVPLTRGPDGCSEDCSGESHPNECTATAPKSAVNLGYQKIDGGWKLTWIPTTDTSDFQILRYGYSPDNLEYGIPNLDKSAFEVDIYGLTKTPFWFQLGSSHEFCIGWTEIIDPA